MLQGPRLGCDSIGVVARARCDVGEAMLRETVRTRGSEPESGATWVMDGAHQGFVHYAKQYLARSTVRERDLCTDHQPPIYQKPVGRVPDFEERHKLLEAPIRSGDREVVSAICATSAVG